MSKRVWTSSLILLALVSAAYAAARHSGPPLLDQHSRPGIAVPSDMVVVTDSGKLFHRPECTYIPAGARKVMSASDAVAQGYTPCTHCYKDLLPR